ncbi:hypothetical protein BGZ60DRAFT_147046 [Tricladium varicosporioides]|nr:hypothetical protein BGZ60DRAFT_147046 [Hymenoscyphus varicosporioides]
MLDRCSLKNLVEISGHPVFGPSLHTLERCVDHLTEGPPFYHLGTWDSPKLHSKFTVYSKPVISISMLSIEGYGGWGEETFSKARP